jgi:uncharacterized protein involved in exopolysaccharide biosynthesis
MIKFGREFIYRPEVGDGGPMVNFNLDGIINAEIRILTSRDLLEKVITTLGMGNLYPGLTKDPSSSKVPLLGVAVGAFEKDLRIESVARSNVINVHFQHEDPNIAAKAVNLLVDLFKEKHLQVYGNPPSAFIETQTKTYEEQLKDSERRLETFKQAKQVFSLEEQRSLLLKQRADLDASLKNNQNRINELQTRLSSLKAQIKSIPETRERPALDNRIELPPERNEAIAQARAQLLTLQLKERELLEKYKESSRSVANVRREIEIVQEFLRQQEEIAASASAAKAGGKAEKVRVEIVENPLYQEVQGDIVRTEADLSAEAAKTPILRRQLSEINAEVQSLDYREKELQTLKREVATNEKNYQAYLEKLEEARLGEDMTRQKMANIVVIEEAAVPTIPVENPKVKKIVLAGLLLGAVLGFGSAYLSEYLSQGLSTPESAERRLGIPVLATFPYKK